MRGASPLLAGLGLLAAGAVAAAATLGGASGDESHAALLRVTTSGKIKLSNSKQDSAVVRAGNLVPGQSARGRVAIGVTTHGSVRLQLAPQVGTGLPGPGGGDLATVLHVKIDRPWALRRANRRALYRGRLADMPNIGLGEVPDGRTRRYRVKVTFPDGGTPASPVEGDNAYQSSNAEASLVWRARAA